MGETIRRRWRRAPGSLALLTSLVVLSSFFVSTGAQVASAAAPTLTTTFSPTSASAGASTIFNLTASSDQGTLVSLSLAASPGTYVAGASSSSGNAQVSGNQTVNVTGLKISGSAVVSISVNAYPSCMPGSYPWILTAVQKGGTAYEPQTFPTTVTRSSACDLAFGPIGSQVKDTLFSVSVAARRANSTIDTTYTDQVSLTIEVDPGVNDARLEGGVPAVTPVDGTATFSIRLDKSGTAYRLEACSPTINNTTCPATGLEDGGRFLSEMFDIFNSRSDCTPSHCFGTAIGDGDVTSATVSSNGKSGQISIGIWRVPPDVSGGLGDLANLDCPFYDEVTTDVVNVERTTGNANGTEFMIVTVTIGAGPMKAIADQGVAHLETCHASVGSFPTKPGTPPATYDRTLDLFVGLLPNCPPVRDITPFLPCNISRMGGGGGTGQISYGVKESDPAGRN
jgi:hypothetical protein